METSPPKVFDSERTGISKEKLLISCFLILKRVRNIDNKLDKKKGIVYDKQIAGKLSLEERSFILKDSKSLTDAYLKYLHKEEWFLKAKKKFPEFRKDSSIR